MTLARVILALLAVPCLWLWPMEASVALAMTFGFYFCCCVTSCPLLSDDFNRGDDTALGAEWTETTGDWSIASNRLTLAAPASGDVLTTVDTIAATSGSDVQAVVRSSAAGDQLRVFAFWITSTNNLYAELQLHASANSATMRIKTGATTLTSCTVDAGLDTDHTLRITMDRPAVASVQPVVTIYLNGVIVLGCQAHSPVSGPSGVFSAALGIGTMTGVPVFDDFVWDKLKNDPADADNGCPAVQLNCWPDQTEELDVTFAGFTNNGCSSCASLNTTFTVSRVGSLDADTTYEYDISPAICNFNKVSVRLVASASFTGCQMHVRLYDTATGDGYQTGNGFGTTYKEVQCLPTGTVSIAAGELLGATSLQCTKVAPTWTVTRAA